MTVWLVYDYEKYSATVGVFASEGAVRDWIRMQPDPDRYHYGEWVVEE